MNDVPLSDDELVSSYLDGEATPAQVARVEGDPRLLARVEEMRAAIELVSAPVSIPEFELDRIRAFAVAASDTTTVVRDLRAAGADRRRGQQLRKRVLAVAAAFVFLGVAVTAVRSIESNTSDTASGDSARDAGDESGDDSDDSGDDADSDGEGLDALSTLQGSDDADEGSGDDAVAAEAVEEESYESDADDEGAAASDSPGLRLGTDAGFDLLPTELAPATDERMLADDIVEAVSNHLNNTTNDSTSPDEPSGTLALPCLAELGDELDSGGFEAGDISIAEVGGEELAVAVAVDGAGQFWMFTAPIDDCTSITFTILDITG